MEIMLGSPQDPQCSPLPFEDQTEKGLGKQSRNANHIILNNISFSKKSGSTQVDQKITI
jgi:hypothetical protein